ncbi:T9SS type A sorting domain-containing protein [Epilithonimonas sp. JDS]|uniref:T9SS type A sorting domain-containing protein n=1 Tax=Epilithonimonas sp. JDS TaxID=2902797 RepID=UPI001E60174B|nr:T9SS type A sorting domain-containing protein [Epilithonimonas sp. JDS]MCD9856814.1 T9SS type A sorting domain-containing protein [Epilithonimonas sp. JDS]
MFFCTLSLEAQNSNRRSPTSNQTSLTSSNLHVNAATKDKSIAQNVVQFSEKVLISNNHNENLTAGRDYKARVENDFTLAPNSYIFYKDGILPDGNKIDGLYIPVAKAYQMWRQGRYMQNDTGTFTPISENGVQSASVFWEDVNGLVSSTSIEGTGEDAKIKILIDKTKGEGNANIAFKVDGVIYWTWHIWVTDDPKNGASYGQDFETDASNQAFVPQYMDRNLGATNAGFLGHDWHKSGGLMYQWGRKDPVPPLEYKDGSFYEVTGDIGSRRHSFAALQSTPIAIKQRGTDTNTNNINGNIRYSINNPIDIITHATNDGTWFSSQEYKTDNTNPDLIETWDLWSDNRKGLHSNASSSNSTVAADSKSYELKSEFDPCPNGWRVASHYGRNTINNNLNPLGRKYSGFNDDTNSANSQILPNSVNGVLNGVKVYPGRGIDFSGTDNRKIGLMPTSGNYIYYSGSDGAAATVVYQDQGSDALLLNATYGIGGSRSTIIRSDPERADVSSTGWNGIYVNQTVKTNGLGAVRCLKDPNIALLPSVYETEYVVSTDDDNTDYKTWTKEPNSFVVMTGDPSDALPQDKELVISLKKAYAMQKLYLSDNKEIPSGNINTGSVIWTDNQSLIKKIQIVGSYPDQQMRVIIATGKKGNAVVAFHKGNNGVWDTSSPDKVIWSWHIWAPVTDPLSEGNQITYTTESLENGGIIPASNGQLINPAKGGTPLTTTFMDRNLGALQALPSSLERPNLAAELESKTQIQQSGGLHYQWGRKDPLPTFHNPGGTQYNSAHANSVQVAAEYNVYKQTGVDANNNVVLGISDPITDSVFSSTNETNGYSKEWNVYKSNAGIADNDPKNEKIRKVIKYATENPLSFLFRSKTGNEIGIEDAGSLTAKASQVKDWISDENGLAQDRWGHATEKSAYDPCPGGWRVPDTANANLFAAGNNGSYAKGSSPWFYNGYNTNSTFANYGIMQSTIADLTGGAVNNAVNLRQYPGYTLTVTTEGTAPSSRSGWVFNFPNSKYNIGNIPATGIRGVLGGNDWKNARSGFPDADNYKYQTGLWTSSPADFYTGYAIGLDLSSTSGFGGKLASGTAFYPQAAMGVRCVKDTERYMGDLPYTNNPDTTYLNSVITIKEYKNDIVIHPNPVKDVLHIVSKSDVQNSRFIIFDMAGSIVKEGYFDNAKINIANLPSGIYMLTLENSPKALKIIKK